MKESACCVLALPLAALALGPSPAGAERAGPGAEKAGPEMAGMSMEEDRPTALLMELASGTSLNPASAPAHMTHLVRAGWTIMLHGEAFVTGAVQTGPRGKNRLYSTDWVMLGGVRRAGQGALMLRAMLSLDPAGVRRGFYPELFQTGEVHNGRPIVDGQHPHDLFMELSASYTRPFGDSSSLLLYAAPVGDPALGPVAFPHRSSNAENPTAVLGHHLQDSTHIAFDVLTAGGDLGKLRIETSGFHGAEPDDHRWGIEQGAIDSWSGRLTYRPSENWAAQASRGRLHHPEEHEPVDISRTTASVLYSRSFGGGRLSTGFIWGRNHLEKGLDLDSWLAEGWWSFHGRNFLFGRLERVDRNELFADDPRQEAAFEVAGIRSFTVNALTLGCTRDFDRFEGLETGIGLDATLYRFPSVLDRFYGANPKAFHLFLRLRPHGKSAGVHGGAHHGHSMHEMGPDQRGRPHNP